MVEKKERKLKEKLKDHYRIVIYHDKTFHAVQQRRFSLRRFLSVVALGIFAIIISTACIMAFTSIRTLIPGYPTDELRNSIIRNTIVLDSLEHEISVRDRYVSDFRRVMSGEDPLSDIKTANDSTVRPDQIKFKKFNHDSIFKDRLEEEKYNLSINKIDHNAPIELSGMLLFAPIKGMVTERFNLADSHFGIDVTAQKDSKISSTLDGTVVLAEYTVKTGYVIQIQHENNIVSTYKHNKELLKEAGDKVKAGEAIAIAGNSGELTTGPHLHFELWYKGTPVDPEMYIHF